jgi:hypothetical protein
MSVKKYYGIIFFIIAISVSSICQAQMHPSVALLSKPPKRITLSQFNSKIDRAYTLLSTKKLSDISDSDHINIIMCLNTIDIYKYGRKQGDSGANRYLKLEILSLQKNYNRDILKIYSYVINTGMGYYFPKLKMALYGAPNDYARFEIIDK